MAVIDVVTWNNEVDLFEIRYNILKDHVEEFRVIEFDKTFSGKEKLFRFPFSDWEKVKYYPVKENQWSKYIPLAKESPNTEYGKGAEHWIIEFAQKESIKDCLTDLNDEDIVFIGDCDEIYNPCITHAVREATKQGPMKIRLYVYAYWLNNRSDELFTGIICGRYKYFKDQILNHIRKNGTGLYGSYWHGWHFTSLKDGLKKKLEDSYTEESYATKEVLENLDKNIEENKDFLGRDFKYRLDESDWPTYLKQNRSKYKHLIKEEDETTK